VTLPGVGSSGVFGGSDRTCLSSVILSFLSDPNRTPDTACAKEEVSMTWVTLP
jgi:hypothetical protein